MSDEQTTEQQRPTPTDADVALPPPETTVGDAEAGEAPPDGATTPPTAADRAGVLDPEPPQADGPGAPSESPIPRPGTPIELDDDGMPPTEVMRTALKAVMDPEIGYNIVDLGLVYDVEKDDEGSVEVTMTLTSMGCPLTEILHQQVSVVLGSLPGVEDVDVEFTFTPPWSPEMMSEDVRLELRAMGMNV